MIDVGCMAKLLLAHNYPEQAYGNLSLQNSVAEVLGYYVDKGERESNWKGENNSGKLNDNQVECE